MQTNNEKKNPYQRFMEWKERTDLDTLMPTICCDHHREALADILGKSERGLTTKQIDFARAIVTGKAKHVVPLVNREETIQCVHAEVGQIPVINPETGKPQKIGRKVVMRNTLIRCTNTITATRGDLSLLKSRCEEHRQ